MKENTTNSSILEYPINSLMISFSLKGLKTTTQMHYDKELFINYQNTGKVLKQYLLIEVNERRRPDLDCLKDNIIQ